MRITSSSPYSKVLEIQRERSRFLRKNLTVAEKVLWAILRKKQLASFRFRRQVPMGPYILDFVCHSVKVIIEADGGQHNQELQRVYDQKRTQWLEQQGYQVLRFWNNEILSKQHNQQGVLEHILKICLTREYWMKSKIPPSACRHLPPQSGGGPFAHAP
jgi:very-short-patch-repair endonuclease